MGDIEKREVYMLVEYTGTEESAKELIDNLKVEEGDYFYSLRKKNIFLHRQRCLYEPGSKYIFRKPENFEAVK